MALQMKLNIGAGSKAEKGYINTDIVKCNGIDVVFDFNKYPWNFETNQFKEVKILNSIHCAEDEIKFMEEVWRITSRGGRVKIESVVFNSPTCCNDPYFKTRIGFTTFDKYCEPYETRKKMGISYDNRAVFKYIKRKWIFSDNKYLRWLSFIPNLCPKFYARFLYYYFPSNKIYIELEAL